MDVKKNVKNTFTRKEKENMKQQINKLTIESKKEIFKIILNNDEKFSENNNGILFNLISLKIGTLNEINNFVIYTKNNMKNIEKTEIEISNYKGMLD